MKRIAISAEAYDRLSEAKMEKESLSDAILRLIPTKQKSVGDIMDLAGSWEGDEEEYQRIVALLAEGRRPPEKSQKPRGETTHVSDH